MQNISMDFSAFEVHFPTPQIFSFKNLQQLWLSLIENPELFHPTPAIELQRHCDLHHCDILPGTYKSLRLPQVRENSENVCLMCQWQADIFRCPDLQYGNFRLAFDPDLPLRPTRKEILGSKSPAIMWVRVSEESSRGSFDIFEVEDVSPQPPFNEREIEEMEPDERSKEACLTGGFDCSHI